MWTETRSSRVIEGKHTSRGRLRYRGRSTAPETASLTLVRPDIERHLSDDELRDRILAKAQAKAEQMRLHRKARGQRKVVGWRNVIAGSYRDVATSRRPCFQKRPRVAATDDTKRAALLDKIVTFEARYRVAVEEFETSREVIFPFGTLQILQRHRVRCET